MNTVPRLFLIAALCGLVVAVGFFAFNAGVDRGLEQQTPIVHSAPGGGGAAQSYAYPYPYFGRHHHHGGFGFFLFPLFFFAFWLVVVRGLFGWRRLDGRGCGPGGRLDEWHRRAHEVLGDPLPPLPNAPAER